MFKKKLYFYIYNHLLKSLVSKSVLCVYAKQKNAEKLKSSEGREIRRGEQHDVNTLDRFGAQRAAFKHGSVNSARSGDGLKEYISVHTAVLRGHSRTGARQSPLLEHLGCRFCSRRKPLRFSLIDGGEIWETLGLAESLFYGFVEIW